MNHTAIGQSKEEPTKSFFTIGELLALAKAYKGMTFRFVDTDFYPSKLSSWRGSCPSKLNLWRGSYYAPQVEYSKEVITGRELADILASGLDGVHHDCKRGECRYYPSMVFYVSSHGGGESYAVFGYELNEENEVILLTDINEY